MEPIPVKVGLDYFVMIDVEGTSAILVDSFGAMTAVAIATVTVVDPNMFAKAKHLNAKPPKTP